MTARREDDLADCGVVIVAFRSADDVSHLLKTLPEAADGLTTRVVVVDNDSHDDIAERMREFPEATLVEAGANLGYAGGINLGRSHVGRTRTTLILNPDLRLQPGSLRTLYEALARTGAGAVVPSLEEEGGGSPYRSLRREPSLSRAMGEACLGDHWPTRPGWLAEVVRRPSDYQSSGPIDWATGAVVLICAEAEATVGEWDSGRFFMYSEETDYLRRIRDAGWQVRSVPEAVAEHRGGGSGRDDELTALCAVNRVRYFRKYHGALATAAFRCVVVLEHLARVRRPGSRRALRALVRGSDADHRGWRG